MKKFPQNWFEGKLFSNILSLIKTTEAMNLASRKPHSGHHTWLSIPFHTTLSKLETVKRDRWQHKSQDLSWKNFSLLISFVKAIGYNFVIAQKTVNSVSFSRGILNKITWRTELVRGKVLENPKIRTKAQSSISIPVFVAWVPPVKFLS